MTSDKSWDYNPGGPMGSSPLFSWPPRLLDAMKWYSGFWFTVSSGSVSLLSAVLFWAFLRPEFSQTGTLAWGWVLQIYATNLALLLLIAGGMHIWFYTWKKQGTALQFDARELKRNNRVFTFSDQVKDNMFWSLASGVSFWTFWEVTYFWSVGNGWVSTLSWSGNIVWFFILILVIPAWISVHFYWIHRALHWPPLYRFAHHLHHRNINTGPWSGLSMHPLEACFFFSSVLIGFVVPLHPIHFLLMLHFLGYGPAIAHCGFEGIRVGGKKRMELGEFYHQLHHRYFECNYGTIEMPWDRWFGTFHDGSEAGTIEIRARRKQMYRE